MVRYSAITQLGLRTCCLLEVTGTQTYINNFMLSKVELDDIPNESLKDVHLSIMFLNNIHEPRYHEWVENMRREPSMTLQQCVFELIATHTSLIKDDHKRNSQIMLVRRITDDQQSHKRHKP